MTEIPFDDVDANKRYPVEVEGVLYAVETSKHYDKSREESKRGLYVNVRLHTSGRGWANSAEMFSGNATYPLTWSNRNVSCFFIQEDGTCRETIPD